MAVRNLNSFLFLLIFRFSGTSKNFSVDLSTFGRNDVDPDVDLLANKAKVITLKHKELIRYFYDNASEWDFAIVQFHTQYRNVSLSTKYNSETYTSSNAAILKLTSSSLLHHVEAKTQSFNYVLQPSKGSPVRGLVVAVSYTGKTPIPGGCCLTCRLEVDPNLVVSSQSYYKCTLTFSVANVYNYNSSLCGGRPGQKPHHYRLQYSLYQYFLEEGNFDEDELFDGLTKMLTPQSVKKHGEKIRVLHPEKDLPTTTFDTKRGQGIVFNILVYDPDTDLYAAYSPVVTYGCSFTAKVDGCDSFGSIVNIVFAVCGSVLGLFICFCGHRFYQLYIVLSGLTLFSFLAFILLTNETEWSHTVRMIVSVCIGIVGASLLYLFWWWTRYRHLVLYICGLIFGFVSSSVLFFTPFGNMSYWRNDVNYWTVFACVSLMVPFVFLLSLKTFVILVSSLVGAYGFVVGIDTFIHSSLSYIILDVIMKATVEDFQKYDIPYQTKDYILSAAWIVLTILGVVVQFIITKGQTTLMPAPRKNRENARVVQVNRSCESDGIPQQSHDRPQPVLANSKRNVDSEFDIDVEEEQLPILVDSRPLFSRRNASTQRPTRYGTNIVC